MDFVNMIVVRPNLEWKFRASGIRETSDEIERNTRCAAVVFCGGDSAWFTRLRILMMEYLEFERQTGNIDREVLFYPG